MINQNKIPNYLEYFGKKYKFDGIKGDVLCYTYEPRYFDDCSGSTIIVEWRKEKRLCDQFYVLFFIHGFSGYDYGYTAMGNLKGYTRQAKPIFEE